METDQLEVKLDEVGQALHSFQDVVERNEKKYDGILADNEKKLGEAIALAEETRQKIERLEAAQKRLPVQYDSKAQKEIGEQGRKHLVNMFSRAVKNSQINLDDYLQGSQEAKDYLEKKQLSVGVDSEGGYATLPTFGGVVMARVFETSPLRSVASTLTIGSDSYEVLLDDDETAGGWSGEYSTSGETDTPDLARKRIPVHDLDAEPKATMRALEDPVIDMEAWLTQKISDKFTREENAAFVTGDGIGKPTGFTTYDNWSSAGVYERGKIERINSGTSAAVTADGFIGLMGALKEFYQPSAVFMMQRNTFTQALKIKDGEVRYLIGAADLNGAVPLQIRGKRVIFADDMPSTGVAGSLAVAYGDFGRGYQIVDRRGMQVLRDPFTSKPFVKFYATKRTGGDVVNFDAIKLMQLT